MNLRKTILKLENMEPHDLVEASWFWISDSCFFT